MEQNGNWICGPNLLIHLDHLDSMRKGVQVGWGGRSKVEEEREIKIHNKMWLMRFRASSFNKLLHMGGISQLKLEAFPIIALNWSNLDEFGGNFDKKKSRPRDIEIFDFCPFPPP